MTQDPGDNPCESNIFLGDFKSYDVTALGTGALLQQLNLDFSLFLF